MPHRLGCSSYESLVVLAAVTVKILGKKHFLVTVRTMATISCRLVDDFAGERESNFIILNR
jgi:hypothetical protein